MLKKNISFAGLLIIGAILLTVAACSSQPVAAHGVKDNNAIIKQTAIKAQVTGDIVTIPLSEVDKYINTKFRVDTARDYFTYMAYQYGGKLSVRSDICPPCGSESFTLKNGTLVCDRCGTVFDAKTGIGIKGACVKYDKFAVPFEVKDGNIVMKGADLLTAYENTLNPK